MKNHATDHHVEISYQIGEMGIAAQNIYNNVFMDPNPQLQG